MYVAYNSITVLFFVKGKGFVGKACDASPLDSREVAVVKASYCNVIAIQS